jgi:hypothetical protein
VRLGRIPVPIDTRVCAEHPLHGGALHALPAPVNEADDLEAGLVGGGEIVFDDRDDVSRLERVQIDRVFNRNVKGVVVQTYSFTYSTVTFVVSAPRAVKSPITVMRRG